MMRTLLRKKELHLLATLVFLTLSSGAKSDPIEQQTSVVGDLLSSLTSGIKRPPP